MNSWKAILTFFLTAATSLIAQVQDKTEFSDLTSLQWVIVLLSAVIAGGAVYLIPPGRGLVTPGPAPRT